MRLAAGDSRPVLERRMELGAATEHLAIARLLALGHKVAVPVVDDDGVDLVVDYRTTVQVKSSWRVEGVSLRGSRTTDLLAPYVDAWHLFAQ